MSQKHGTLGELSNNKIFCKTKLATLQPSHKNVKYYNSYVNRPQQWTRACTVQPM